MKILLLIISMGLATSLFSQDIDTTSRYYKTMKSNLEKLDTAESQSTFIKVGNIFERVANAEKSKWLPYYWAAYCNLIASFSEEDKAKKNSYLNKAEKQLDMADSLSPDNSEIYTLKSFWYTGKMQAEGFASAPKYGPLSTAMLDSAKAYDADNPRQYYLRGTGLYYTPPMFGGGKEKAKGVLETCVEKYGIFVPASGIHPDWGLEQAEEMLKNCKAELEEEGDKG